MRQTISRWLAGLVGSAGIVVAATYAGACNTADLTQNPPCRGDDCSCEEDPTQPLCRGYNERPDGAVFPEAPIDASEILDASESLDASEAGDAGDAAADG